MWTMAAAQRWVRPLLLAGTLVGLTAMHTIGHDAHAAASDHHKHSVAHAAAIPAAVGDLTPPSVAPATADRPHPAIHDRGAGTDLGTGGTRAGHPEAASPAGGGDGNGDLPGWGACLAVLGALAVPLLLAVLITARRSPAAVSTGRRGRVGPVPRAPPSPVGLRIATVSVLRR
ncbi:hypothetical protein [Micromonospora nigra]|uniref:hypothetical protein n=1 Tax=Micromonospora nigra TaxID=145857 RepID=UPI001585D555|nr:hypothetical protein [Micromonospora nigra]